MTPYLRLCQVLTRCPPAVWNVHEAIHEGRNKTNNQCESYIDSTNPCLWTVIDFIHSDTVSVATNIIKHEQRTLRKKSQERCYVSPVQIKEALCQVQKSRDEHRMIH